MKRLIIVSALVLCICFSIASCTGENGDIVKEGVGKEGYSPVGSVISPTALPDNSPIPTTEIKEIEQIVEEKNEEVAVKKDLKILDLLDLKKDQIIELLGTDYEEIMSGAEASDPAIYFKEYGIDIMFAGDDSVDIIYLHSECNILGVNTTMTFEQIMQVLGEREIEKGWYQSPDIKVYYLKFEFDSKIVLFMSFDKNEVYRAWCYKKREN